MKTKSKNQELAIKQRNAAKVEVLLKQLANANRLMILCTLVAGEKTAGSLLDNVNLSQSALSQHLAKLREAKLVESEKRGKMVYYRISSMEAQALLSVLYVMFCKEEY